MGRESAPESIETERLQLRRPRAGDAAAIFAGYSADPEVTRYLGWPRHRSITDTDSFLVYAGQKWDRDQVGPYLVFDRIDSTLLGGTGLELEDPETAMTGYVIARSAWGRGFATEALQCMLRVGAGLALKRVQALCHPDHAASIRVLEKCGFELAGNPRQQIEFPNIGTGVTVPALRYEYSIPSSQGQ